MLQNSIINFTQYKLIYLLFEFTSFFYDFIIFPKHASHFDRKYIPII